ncbi:MAG TPA: hypothetical protein DDZ76_01175, partial [Xanthomonadales bacterium]|nr:hypothetical protein [Xanthomonadales bacterium]
HRGATAISERLLTDVGLNAARWGDVLDQLATLVPGPEAALTALEHAEPHIVDATDRDRLRQRLRHFLHLHRRHRAADWAQPAEVLDRLHTVYERLTPADPL